MEFKDPELRLPKYPMSFTVLSESLEVKRTDDGLPLTEFLKITKIPTSDEHAEHRKCTEKEVEESSTENELDILHMPDGDVGHKKRKRDDSQSSIESDLDLLLTGSQGDAERKKRRKDEDLSSVVSELEVLDDFLSGEDTDVMISNLNRCIEKSNINQLKNVVSNSKSEKDLATGFGIHLISMLAGNASTKTGLREGNKCPCGCSGKLQGNTDMWIGSEDIWHGELDIIAGNKAKGDDLVACTLQKEDGTEQIDCDEEALLSLNESPGERVNVEIKSCPGASNMSQVVAQSVVFAFTEWNRHREKGRLIPSVLLAPTFFQVLIYDPVDDFLFQSNKFYFSFDENDCRPFFILWIILNHRKFFLGELPSNLNLSCSGFKRIMNSYPEKISIFEKMNSYKPQILVRKSVDTGHAVYSNEMIYRDCYIEAQKRCFSESD